MFKIDKNIELNELLLNKMLNTFYLNNEPHLIKNKKYYDGIQKILEKSYSDTSKPCSKTVINYCKNIVDTYCGYLASPGFIKYQSREDIEDILNILRYNDYQDEDADFLLNALIYGVSAELMYNDNEGKTRFKLINPEQCFGIYDDSLTNDLLYFVRFYKKNDWNDSNTFAVDVYNDKTIKHYEMAGRMGNLVFVNEEPHYFNQCPANIFYLPDEKGIFECIIGLQDTANELLNNEVDDFSAFVDAFLVLTNASMTTEQVSTMKEKRVIALPEGATAQWLTKNASDTQIENMLKRIEEAIYRISACPDLSSESFIGGVSSGIAIKYRLTGIETRAAKIEGAMKKALQRRIEIICGVASLKLGEEVFRDIEISFKRNIPESETEIVGLVNSLKGIVSNETLLSLLPFVDNIDDELERLNAENAVYNFNDKDDEDESNQA